MKKLTCKDRELALADKIYVASSLQNTSRLSRKLAENSNSLWFSLPLIKKTAKYIHLLEENKSTIWGGLSQRKGILFFDAIKGLENDLEVTVGSEISITAKVLKSTVKR